MLFQAGYNISYVSLNYEDPDGSWGHSFNATYLADGSSVRIEPQNDRIYRGTIEEFLQLFLKVSWVKNKEIATTW
jgi:hypothetical protein